LGGQPLLGISVFTVRLRRADDQELGQLPEALGAPQPNPTFPGSAT
jgi:hypothetical protein